VVAECRRLAEQQAAERAAEAQKKGGGGGGMVCYPECTPDVSLFSTISQLVWL
jgi:hypothetical protein